MRLLRGSRGWSLAILFTIIFVILSVTLNYRGYFITKFRPIINSIEKKQILTDLEDYKNIETENFIIRYKANDELAAQLTSEIAESHYNEVCDMFNYYPDKKVNIVVYDNSSELLKSTNLNKETPPLGVYYGGVINVLSPSLWINDEDRIKDIYEKDGPIVHEFAHLIIDEISKGNYPMWLTEGIALYTEYSITGFEWGKGIEFNEKVSIEELNNSFYEIDQNLAYRKSFEVVRYISDTWGFDKLVLILDDMGRGNNFVNSTEVVLKINSKDLKPESISKE